MCYNTGCNCGCDPCNTKPSYGITSVCYPTSINTSTPLTFDLYISGNNLYLTINGVTKFVPYVISGGSGTAVTTSTIVINGITYNVGTDLEVIITALNTYINNTIPDILNDITILEASSHPPLNVTNTNTPFSFNTVNQILNVPITPTLVNNGNGTFTYNPNNGSASVTVNFNAIQFQLKDEGVNIGTPGYTSINYVGEQVLVNVTGTDATVTISDSEYITQIYDVNILPTIPIPNDTFERLDEVSNYSTEGEIWYKDAVGVNFRVKDKTEHQHKTWMCSQGNKDYFTKPGSHAYAAGSIPHIINTLSSPGDTIVVYGPIPIAMEIRKNLVIDLSSGSLYNILDTNIGIAYTTIMNNAIVEFKNGTIIQDQNQVVFTVNSGSTLVLTNMRIKNLLSDAINLVAGGKLILQNCVFDVPLTKKCIVGAGGYYGLGGNYSNSAADVSVLAYVTPLIVNTDVAIYV